MVVELVAVDVVPDALRVELVGGLCGPATAPQRAAEVEERHLDVRVHEVDRAAGLGRIAGHEHELNALEPAVVGLILGIVALVKINNSQGQLRGLTAAIVGIVLSALMVLMLPIMAAMLVPALSRAKIKAQSVQCMNHVKQLNLALMMVKRQQIIGSVLRSRPVKDKGAIVAGFAGTALPKFADRTVVPIIEKSFPIDQVAQAHRMMEEDRHFGKIVLSIS